MTNYILIGFMGSGKSSVGRYMHAKHGYQLIDTDSYIEKLEGRSIQEIFATEGEEYFRDLETHTLELLVHNNTNNTVIAVGGGLPMRKINRILLHELGTIVYLKARPETLERRLAGDDHRPLLKGGSLRERIRTLMEEREDTYEKVADLVIGTDNRKYAQIYKDIIRRQNEKNSSN